MSETENNEMGNMVEPDTTSIKIESFDLNTINDLNNALVQLVNLNPDNIIHEPTCIICRDPYRQEAEELWKKDKNHKEVVELFKTKSNTVVSEDIIDNHMIHHYGKGIKELQKIEYTDRIKRLNSVNLTTLDRIRLCFSALTERLMGINSIVPSGDLSAADIEKIKSSETSRLMGSFNQLLKLQASIMGEMKNNGELIIIPRQIFVNVFNEAIARSSNDEEKNTIQKILSNLATVSKNIQ